MECGEPENRKLFLWRCLSRGKVDTKKMNNEYEEFLRDPEENPKLRFNISLYRNMEYQPSEAKTMKGHRLITWKECRQEQLLNHMLLMVMESLKVFLTNLSSNLPTSTMVNDLTSREAVCEARSVPAVVLLRHGMTVLPGHKVEQKMSLTLFMKHGLLVNVHKRDRPKLLVPCSDRGVVLGF
ncbi:hypothetical protein Droror1_Dr00020629 [Drosera rotundifolia]